MRLAEEKGIVFVAKPADYAGGAVTGESINTKYCKHVTYLLQFGAAAATYVPQLAVITSTNPFGSDHVPYINAGVRTALAIDNDWDLYPHYHRSTDTPSNMGPNAQPMGGAILKTNAAVIAEIAGLDNGEAPLFDDGFEGPSVSL